MTDLYLVADTEAALVEALPFLRDGDEWRMHGHSHALDLIGPVVTTPATFGEQGEEITAAVVDTRFHANLRCTEEVAALVPASITIPAPVTPARVWA